MKFADTNFLVALLNPKDQWHSVAKEVAGALDESVVTTMWVLLELGDALSVGSNRNLFLEFVDQLSEQPEWETVPASPDWFVRGLELFRSRKDKDWPLTDCISFVVMKQRDITEALTHDHHFEQAGFRILLKD
jgi:predicted nucleic acid-binding protein